MKNKLNIWNTHKIKMNMNNKNKNEHNNETYK